MPPATADDAIAKQEQNAQNIAINDVFIRILSLSSGLPHASLTNLPRLTGPIVSSRLAYGARRPYGTTAIASISTFAPGIRRPETTVERAGGAAPKTVA